MAWRNAAESFKQRTEWRASLPTDNGKNDAMKLGNAFQNIRLSAALFLNQQ